FSPLQQSEKTLYMGNPKHTDAASMATVYTMLAHGVGNADNVAALANAKISAFWIDGSQKAHLTPALDSHLNLGAMKAIPAPTKLTNANVIGQLNAHRPVILRGTYTKAGGGTGTHYMLATLYTKNPNNSAKTVVANDPFTGTQLEISPVTKKVVGSFPLKN